MAVTILGELPRKKRILPDFNREYTRAFIGVGSTPLDTATIAEASLLVAFGVVKGSVHPEDVLALCSELETTQTDDRLGWSFTCKYTTARDENQPSPTDRPTLYSWSTEWVERGEARDLDGKDIVNSANESFDPPAARRVPVQVCKATCTRVDFDHESDYDPYVDHVNSVAWTIDGRFCVPGQALMDEIAAEMVDEQGEYFRRVTYTVKIRKDLFTTANTTTVGPSSAGTNVIVTLVSTAGIVIGSEIVIGGELVIVHAVGGGTVTVDLANNHAGGETVVVRSYDPWQYQPLDMGFNGYDPVKNVNREFTTDSGVPLSHPCLLDGAGSRLGTWTGADPVRLKFRLRESQDFNGISFP